MMGINGIAGTLERKAAITQAKPNRHTTLRKAAETLSLRNADAAIIELFNEAIARMVDLAFEEDAGGLCNLDSATGRVLIPLPWGRNGCGRWGLRPQEANILREILFSWQHDPRPLFQYDKLRRSWFVNLAAYTSQDDAGVWLARHQVGIAVYRTAYAKRVDNS
jgi:hypothetical protein